MPERMNQENGEPPQARARRVDGFTETRVKTRRAVRSHGDVVYGADVEMTRVLGDEENPELVTEEHAGSAQGACGCLIEGNTKPRFHRDGTMVCQSHYYFCSICSRELLPRDLVVVEKRAYCAECGEQSIDEILWTEKKNPGTFEKLAVAHLLVLKRTLRDQRWRRFFGQFFSWRRPEALP